MSLAHQSSNYQYTWNMEFYFKTTCVDIIKYREGKKKILNVIDYLLIENSSTETSIL